MSSKAANEFIETAGLVRVYENLQKLYSAAWMIHQRLSDNPYLKNNTGSPGKKENNSVTGNVNLYQLDMEVPSGHEEIAGKIIAIIKHKVSSVQAVI